jgi:hypothetical protein
MSIAWCLGIVAVGAVNGQAQSYSGCGTIVAWVENDEGQAEYLSKLHAGDAAASPA